MDVSFTQTRKSIKGFIIAEGAVEGNLCSGRSIRLQVL